MKKACRLIEVMPFKKGSAPWRRRNKEDSALLHCNCTCNRDSHFDMATTKNEEECLEDPSGDERGVRERRGVTVRKVLPPYYAERSEHFKNALEVVAELHGDERRCE